MVNEKGCESCRKWQEHYYWEHMDVTKIRFFKIMTGDFTQGISVPEKFVKNFNGQITKGLDLKVPSGETWHVGVEKHDEELHLTSGWKDFVKAHQLKENELLTFTCRGNSKFDILMFEASGCEKLSSLFSNRIGPDLHKHLNGMDEHAEPYAPTDSEEATMPLTKLGGSTHMASNSRKCNCKTKPTKESQSLNGSSYHVKHEGSEEEESDDRYAHSKFYYSRTANQLTEEEKEKILSLASIQSENPAFVTVLQKTHRQRRCNLLVIIIILLYIITLYKQLNDGDTTDAHVQVVPSRFAADHLQERTHEIILCRPSRNDKWFVRYCYTRYTRGFQNLQFFKFVQENKLCEGDICVFELMKGAKRVTMTVHVIRKVHDRFVLVR
ncbi:hypothetical protein HU200_039875 [Digitaria exilis]|uniref:TF-B3 domain-containing protein n=1 Tax=Digitaria exilis TaxID=1010633 RepID=A0A835BBN9_9POAL|nr:hypothetical protein HU200_039875 [Digitaria exilis]